MHSGWHPGPRGLDGSLRASDAPDRCFPDKSTVRKLARRLGPEVVAEITRMVIEKAQRETRFNCAGGADRFDGGGGRHPLPV
jgi:hypothetical protein